MVHLQVRLSDRSRHIDGYPHLIMRRAMYFNDFSIHAGREFVQTHGAVNENEILKAAADALSDKMAAELIEVVGVAIDPPFGGWVPFGKRSSFPHAMPRP